MERWGLAESTVNGTIQATEVRARIAAESHHDRDDRVPERMLLLLPPVLKLPDVGKI
jgi:hypothetical protein